MANRKNPNLATPASARDNLSLRSKSDYAYRSNERTRERTTPPPSPKPRPSRRRVATITIVTVAICLLTGTAAWKVRAETRPGGPDNGLTSRLKSLSDTLAGLGYGSTTNTPDWGAMWNRVSTAAQFTPSGNSGAADVRSGKTFYGGSRTQLTGTYPAPGACSNQNYHDSYGMGQTEACTSDITWTVVSGQTGDEKRDPRTGLIWSQCLQNSSGTVIFSNTCSQWSWDASYSSNVAVGNKTASQLCSERNGGGVWHLPSQKELMQAYIDGANFNLSNPANLFWSMTQVSGSQSWSVGLNGGGTATNSKTDGNRLRCVR